MIRRKLKTSKLQNEMLSLQMKCFFTTHGGHLSKKYFASNGVTLIIFFSLPMVGQVFCLHRQWWVTSSDFFFPPPMEGHFKGLFFLPPMGGHFK